MVFFVLIRRVVGTCQVVAIPKPIMVPAVKALQIKPLPSFTV